MSDTPIIIMSAEEARAAVSEIRDHFAGMRKHFGNIRERALEFYERQGWVALGYNSYRACADAEFGYDASYLYRLKDAAEVERNLQPLLSPIGEKSLPESHTREIGKLEEPEAQRDAYAAAVQAATEEGHSPTAVHMASAVTQVKSERTPDDIARELVENSHYVPVIQWMRSGKLKPQAALALVDTLNQCRPSVRGEMIRLQLTDTTLIRMLNERWKSESYAEVITSRHLQFADERSIPIQDAKPSDLRAWLDERSREKRQQSITERNQRAGVEIIPVNIYKCDPARTAQILIDNLPASDIDALVKILSEYQQKVSQHG